MPTEISPKQVQDSVQRGFKRLANFRGARVMFLRQFAGPYYDRPKGDIGREALNLIFNAVRVLVPRIVMNFPKHHVESRFLASRDYAELLGLALDYNGKTIGLKDVYRGVVVDAIFTLGIMKTGLAEADSVLAFDEDTKVDVGTIYTDRVDFDNFVADPNSQDHLFRDAAYLGDRITVARQTLLESGLYENDLIEQLPRVGEDAKRNAASNLSMRSVQASENADFEDEVAIVELWVPEANVMITVPGSKGTVFDRYLRVDDYYGPDEGPYTLLGLTPPMPSNPLPIPAVGIWHDLHVLANKMAGKVIDQALQQKNVLAYRRSAADDAAELRDAGDGEAVAVDDPDGIKVHSFGGQQQSNEIMTAQLHNWFNMMSANPQGIGGQSLDAESATEARILQGNANIGLEDMKDLVYQAAASEARKRAWYLHTDPFIKVPLIRRDQIPAQYQQTAMGPVMTQPPEIVDRQVILTPEARRGDWLDFTFEIQPESLGRVDAQTRLRQAMDFAVRVMPAATQVAQTMLLLQIPFDIKAYIVRMAKDIGIDWMDEVFYDPQFQAKMMQMMMSGPGPAGSRGQPGSSGGAGDGGMAALMQNGQPGTVMAGMPTEMQQGRQDAQQGANVGQAELRGAGDVLSGLI